LDGWIDPWTRPIEWRKSTAEIKAFNEAAFAEVKNSEGG
jgi:hypothetical protein